MSDGNGQRHVVIVGGGFAGVGCARELAKHDAVRVTLLDRNNYHQFQPLLYQVATSQLAPSDIAYSLRKLFRDRPNVDVKLAEIAAVDPATRTVKAADGQSWTGDAVVLAAGSRPNFFRTPGAETHSFPLYTLDQATRLRSRILELFEDADRSPELIDRGALNFVVVGAGATGVEVAGALADLIHDTMSVEYHHLAVSAARIHLVDLGHVLLGPFSDGSHEYAAKVLQRKGVRTHLGVAVTAVRPDEVELADGTTIPTHCVIWGGGIQAAELATAVGLAQGRGGRLEVLSDLSVDGAPGVHAAGDFANIPDRHGDPLPQLGSVALQSGAAVADNVLADFAGKPRKPFDYHDKGIMAMIGRGAAVAEVGPHRHELHGHIAHTAWLGVHAGLMTGVRNRVDAFLAWGWDAFSSGRGPQVLDRSDDARIDWDHDQAPEPVVA
ncbi:MAG TPA: NAD(P)/FAD-dependent oxidoreductase [Solirubrobacteraceae bacterium]|nr:NAD(P)/FAD-dependent oxidoreductase [Solirubrobacteraceae bacterium]